MAAIPFLITEGDSVFWLYVIVLLSSSVRQFFDPANDAVLPEVATEEELAAANSMMAIAEFGSTAVGFALAGLLAQFSVELVFFIDAGTFLVAAGLIALVRIPKLEVEEKTTVGDVVRNLAFGAKFIAETPILLSLNLLRTPVMVIFGLQNVLLLPFALEVLNATEFEYGMQEGVTSVGFVIGSLAIARYADRLREGTWLILSFLGMGLAGVAYALTTNIWLAIGLIGISGDPERTLLRRQPADQPAQHAARDARPGLQHELRAARRLLPGGHGPRRPRRCHRRPGHVRRSAPAS